jgi:hypothetical protein
VARLPNPPPAADLARVPPSWQTLRAGTELWRIYSRAGPHPTTWRAFRDFGPTAMRFDHHLPPSRQQERKILYAAPQILTCLAEVFQDTGFIDPGLSDRWLVGFRTTQALRLLNLRGLWPTRAGASMALNTGDRARVQLWSRAIHEAYPRGHGLWYASAMHAHQPALALYERAEDVLSDAPFFHRALGDPLLRAVLEQAAHTFRYGLGP